VILPRRVLRAAPAADAAQELRGVALHLGRLAAHAALGRGVEDLLERMATARAALLGAQNVARAAGRIARGCDARRAIRAIDAAERLRDAGVEGGAVDAEEWGCDWTAGWIVRVIARVAGVSGLRRPEGSRRARSTKSTRNVAAARVFALRVLRQLRVFAIQTPTPPIPG